MKMKKGFTLIELVIVIVVIAVLGWVGVSATLTAADSWLDMAQRKELIADGRLGLERILREVRMVKDTTSVIEAAQTGFRFIDADDNDVKFSFNSGLVSRTKAGAANGLLGNVASFAFTYYDTNGLEIALPIVAPSATNIKRVKVSLSLSKAPGRVSYLESGVSPRNL